MIFLESLLAWCILVVLELLMHRCVLNVANLNIIRIDISHGDLAWIILQMHGGWNFLLLVCMRYDIVTGRSICSGSEHYDTGWRFELINCGARFIVRWFIPISVVLLRLISLCEL